MAELREKLSRAGLQGLQTYIQSGNLVFRSDKNSQELILVIEDAIHQHFGFEVPTLVMSKNTFITVLKDNPFDMHHSNTLYVTFMDSAPSEDLVKALPPSSNPTESYHLSPQAVYVYCPDGYGKTKISNTFFEKKLKVTASTRNWNTCQKLKEMVENLDNS